MRRRSVAAGVVLFAVAFFLFSIFGGLFVARLHPLRGPRLLRDVHPVLP